MIENRAGASGAIGAEAVAKAAPDGYTLGMATTTTHVTNTIVNSKLAYDPVKDFTPIALIARMPYVLVVNPELPVHSVADLVKLARDKPGQLTFASVGPGTIHHLNAEMFKSIFDLNVVHVPYKGTAPALQDVVGGHVQFMFADVPPAKAPSATTVSREYSPSSRTRPPAVTEPSPETDQSPLLLPLMAS